MKKYTCPCCGYKTLDNPVGEFDICPICYWEADFVQSEDPNFKGGPNRISLKEAQYNFIKYGWSRKEVSKYVREPTYTDKKDYSWVSPVKPKEFTIDGDKFSDLEGFYNEFYKILTDNKSFYGRNPNAFDEVLYGGFGKYKIGEKIILVWKNFKTSIKKMNKKDLNMILEIIEDHNDQISLVKS